MMWLACWLAGLLTYISTKALQSVDCRYVDICGRVLGPSVVATLSFWSNPLLTSKNPGEKRDNLPPFLAVALRLSVLLLCTSDDLFCMI